MKRKRMISILAAIMAVLMVLSLMASIIPSAHAVSMYDINVLRAEKEELDARVAESQERLDALRSEQSTVLQKKVALEESNKNALAELDLIGQEIGMYDEIIAEKSAELEAALDREKVQQERYRARVRAMEENGGYNILAVIVRSSNFSQMLAGFDDMGEIMESDKTLERQYRAAREEVAQVKADYEEIRQDCQSKQEELREEQTAIQQQVNATQKELADLHDEIEAALDQYEVELEEELAASEELTQLILAYQEEQRALAAARAAAAAAAGGSVDSGGSVSYVSSGDASFVWPVPSSNRISSNYGGRSDPFTGAGANHAGLDIDGFGQDGKPVVAAAGGTVIAASSNSGYGNYVIVDHGNGLQTVYAHMEDLSVSAGQTVSAGQEVGSLGATGRATGTHCHFEVRENGSTVDPLNYF